jgi:hypothetical protein
MSGVSTSEITVRLIAAFLSGGAVGAVAVQLIAGHQRRGERLAERRQDPYDQLILAARPLVGLMRTFEPDESGLLPPVWTESMATYNAAINHMEPVRSAEMYELAGDLMLAVTSFLGALVSRAAAEDDIERSAADDDRAEALEAANTAYESLREQAQRETGVTD